MVLLTSTDLLDFLDGGSTSGVQGLQELLHSVEATLRFFLLLLEALALVCVGLLQDELIDGAHIISDLLALCFSLRKVSLIRNVCG